MKKIADLKILKNASQRERAEAWIKAIKEGEAFTVEEVAETLGMLPSFIQKTIKTMNARLLVLGESKKPVFMVVNPLDAVKYENK